MFDPLHRPRPGNPHAATEDHLMIRDMARDFAREQIKPHAADWDRERRFPGKHSKPWANSAFSAC